MLTEPGVGLMARIDDRRGHGGVQGDAIGMTLIMRHHLHPRVERRLRSLIPVGQAAHRAAIALVQDGGQQLILRRIMMQQPRLGNIRCPRNIRQGGRHVAAGREESQCLGEDACLLVLRTGLGASGPARRHYLCVVAHAGCSTLAVTELPTTHHSVPRAACHPIGEQPSTQEAARSPRPAPPLVRTQISRRRPACPPSRAGSSRRSPA